MKLTAPSFVRDRAAAKAFNEQDASFRELVFYSEGSGDWPHLGPVVQALLRMHGKKVSYLTSDPKDPGLEVQDDQFRPFMIGSGTTRTVLFRKIDCRQFVMTIPDLQQMWLKRSVHPVLYRYLFHSTNSSHTVYRKGAFNAYDTIYCVGPYHFDEIRRTEAHYSLKAKELVPAGSVKLDTMVAQFRQHQRGVQGERPVVLLAPSWGTGSFIEMPIGIVVVQALLAANMQVVLRLHPMTVRHHGQMLAGLRSTFAGQPLFRLEEDMSATESWLRSNVMVSDWSGAAAEYAFSLDKPVVFINTPQKIRNPDWQAIELPGFEDFIRHEIGKVIQIDQIGALPSVVRESLETGALRSSHLRATRAKWIFNVGGAADSIARHLVGMDLTTQPCQ